VEDAEHVLAGAVQRLEQQILLSAHLLARHDSSEMQGRSRVSLAMHDRCVPVPGCRWVPAYSAGEARKSLCLCASAAASARLATLSLARMFDMCTLTVFAEMKS